MQQSTLHLPEHPTLAHFQEYVTTMVAERGFSQETISEKFVLFLEECGEFAKAARKASGLKTDATSAVHQVGAEAADVFIYLLDICNRFGVDLEAAFRAKEEKNKQRNWE